MTGIITSLPPLVEQPPGNNSSNPAGLPGVTYTVALLTLPQTWSAPQSFADSNLIINGTTSGNLKLRAADASGFSVVRFPAGSTDFSATGGTSQVIKQTSVGGAFTVGQLGFSDISGSVAGTQLPNPSATTLGGVQSLAAVASRWINTISTSGVPSATQPAFTDVSGSVAASQMPALTGDVTTGAGAVATTIANNAVTNAKAAQMAANTIKGNNTGALANAADLTGAQVEQMLLFTQTGTGAVQRTVDSKLKEWKSVTDFGASGSSQTTTGTISAGSPTLTLAAALDFANNQGVLVFGAGPAPTVGVPSPVSLNAINATGTTRYDYQIASLDNQGGLSAANVAFNITNGFATLGAYQSGTTGIAMNKIVWTNGSGSPLATVVWRSTNGGAYVLLGCFLGTSIYDTGLPTQTIAGIPATPPAAAVPGWLATTISSGGGTTTLTLAANAVTSVAGALVQHDDTAAINSATAANTAVAFPAGTYNVRGLQIPATVQSVIGAGSGASIINSFAQTASLGAGVSAVMGGARFFMSGMKIVAANPMAYDGFTLSTSNKAVILGNEFAGANGLRIYNSTDAIVSENQISGWWNIGIYSDTNTNAVIHNNRVGAVSGQCGAVALTATPTGSGYVWGTGILAVNGTGSVLSANTVTPFGASFGMSSQEPNAVIKNNVVKHSGREAIVTGGNLATNFKVQGNYCYWAAPGNGNQSGYDFGMSMADDGTHLISVGDISGNTFINSAFASIGVFGSATASGMTNIAIQGNTIIGSNQLTAHPAGIELSGSATSKIVAGTNTFLLPGANMTYCVAEANNGTGVPNNNTVDTQLGVSGTSGVVSLSGANSISLGNGSLSYTPTVVCVTATATATGKWERISKTKVFVQITITVSGAGNITSVSLPTTSASPGVWAIEGRESTAGGFWYGNIAGGSTTAAVFRSDNTNSVANGYTINLSGMYDSA